MDNIKTIVDEKPFKERLKKSIILSWVVVICVTLGVVLVAMNLFLFHDGEPISSLVAVIGYALIIIYFFVIFSKSSKAVIKRYKDDPLKSEIAFNEDHLILYSYRGDDKIGEDKFYYRECAYYVTTENYVFLSFKTGTFTPINKSDELESFLLLKGIKKRA
jgi:Ca2+/Na+ antiporter